MQLEISRKTELAARALSFLVLHGDGKVLKGSRLAEHLDTTIHYLPQVMKPLVTKGWVGSDPGPTGGYHATTTATNASMLELIEAIEGPFETNVCVLREGPCDGFDQCALHNAWSRARNALIDELQATPVVNGAEPVPAGHQHVKGDNQ